MRFVTPELVRRCSPAAVIALVEDEYGYRRGTLKRGGNKVTFAHPRHLAAFLLTEFGLSLPEAGRALGRHHTTIINSRNFMLRQMEEDPEVFALVDRFTKRIASEPAIFMRLGGRLPMPGGTIKRRTPQFVLPNAASGKIKGLEELDALILAGKGDVPRLSVDQLNKSGAVGVAAAQEARGSLKDPAPN